MDSRLFSNRLCYNPRSPICTTLLVQRPVSCSSKPSAPVPVRSDLRRLRLQLHFLLQDLTSEGGGPNAGVAVGVRLAALRKGQQIFRKRTRTRPPLRPSDLPSFARNRMTMVLDLVLHLRRCPASLACLAVSHCFSIARVGRGIAGFGEGPGSGNTA